MNEFQYLFIEERRLAKAVKVAGTTIERRELRERHAEAKYQLDRLWNAYSSLMCPSRVMLALIGCGGEVIRDVVRGPDRI